MTHRPAKPRLTRRTALRTGAATAAVVALGTIPRAALAAQSPASISQLEPDAGRWTTWVIDSGSDLRPPPPDIGATSRYRRSTLSRCSRLSGTRLRWTRSATGIPGRPD